MKKLGKRIVVLAVFGAGFGFVLLVAMAIQWALQTTRLSSGREAPGTSVERESSRPAPLPLPPAKPEAPSLEQNVATSEPPSVPPEETEESMSLEDMFLSGQEIAAEKIDWSEVKQLLQDHVNRNHPRLKLSDADYERLAASMKMFREANEKMRSMERTSANAPAIRQSIEDAKTAMNEFEQITGMSPNEFFMGEDAPVRFGDDPRAADNDDEIVTEYLSDYRP